MAGHKRFKDGSWRLMVYANRCLWMPTGPDPGDVKRSSFLQERLETVRRYRAASTTADTRKYADRPYRFFRIPQPSVPYIGIPRHVSENHRWFTVAHLTLDVIASDAIYTALDPDGFLFGLMSSAMYIAWLRGVGGALESRLRFSNTIVHNPFPLPPAITPAHRKTIAAAGEKVRAAREAHAPATLGELYDPLATPPDLVVAHAGLDRTVDSLFAPRRRFATDEDRLTVLLDHYQALSAPLAAAAGAHTRRRRR